ncbi:WD repeat-containing protein on Y chromosome-like [Lingula anatina]|uniref:WD repeat-containing protein on Y chromosome-like n=1 Tax=Lingula anatina TaxID=7574 RepID=A0A1S3J0D0_LINAN|nr:WD repeat-containing protein on Y chromosome-like [Lingula anatina]|eukprot:XP_013403706.1 WD repeat-containing protein on Y chromosome-like [Lingula anatina]
MVSGHIFCHLFAPVPKGYKDQSLDGDLSINKLLFLRSRAYKKDAASLIAGGPRGYLHFWNVFHGGSLYAQFTGTKHTGAMVTAMELYKNDTILFTADSVGFIYCWNVEGYCAKSKATDSPELITYWRGHVESITNIDVIEEHKMMISSSLDCTVRLWTIEGHYVGTLGQPDPWDVFNPNTFQHPMVPYDVLVDPKSLPSHPVIAGKLNLEEVLHGDKKKDKVEEKIPPAPVYGEQTYFVDDATIAEQIKQKPFNKGTGKRVRHERMKARQMKIDRDGPSEYRLLQTFPLVETPDIKPPEISGHNDDPFNFYDD